MDRRWPAEDDGELVGIGLGDKRTIERFTEPLLEEIRTVESSFHGELLVEQHPDEQRQSVLCEEPVGIGIAGPRQQFRRHEGTRYLSPAPVRFSGEALDAVNDPGIRTLHTGSREVGGKGS